MCSINKHFTEGMGGPKSSFGLPDVSNLRSRHCSLKKKARVSKHLTEFIDVATCEARAKTYPLVKRQSCNIVKPD